MTTVTIAHDDGTTETMSAETYYAERLHPCINLFHLNLDWSFDERFEYQCGRLPFLAMIAYDAGSMTVTTLSASDYDFRDEMVFKSCVVSGDVETMATLINQTKILTDENAESRQDIDVTGLPPLEAMMHLTAAEIAVWDECLKYVDENVSPEQFCRIGARRRSCTLYLELQFYPHPKTLFHGSHPVALVMPTNLQLVTVKAIMRAYRLQRRAEAIRVSLDANA